MEVRAGQPCLVKKSPYHFIRKGERGRYIFVKNYCRHAASLPAVPRCCRDDDAVLRVVFADGRSALFRPYEIDMKAHP